MVYGKCFSIIILALILYSICSRVNAIDLRVAFWTDPIQKNIRNDISAAIKKIEALQPDVNIKGFTVYVDSVDNKNEIEAENKLCTILSSEGLSVVIDFSYQRWQTGINYLANHGIPILRVDRVISPFLRSFAEFLHRKRSNDLVMIFQSEQDEIEAFFHLMDGYPFRTMLANAIDEKNFIERLQNLRPLATYFAIFATSSNMNTIFEKIKNGKLFARPEEWHFVFLDPGDSAFMYWKEAENATKFLLNPKSICQSMNMDESYCKTEFSFQRAIIFNILRSLADFVKSNPNSLLPIKASSCNEPKDGVQAVPDLLEELQFYDFVTHIESEYYKNDFSEHEGEQRFIQKQLSFQMNISISTISSEAIRETNLAVWQSGRLETINETISPAKRFFRIGTTEAVPWSYLLRDEKTNEIVLDENGKPIWQGYCIDLVDAMAEKLNFDYELVEPSKGKFGRQDTNTGLWDGIVGDLVTGETDFSATALKMYSEREEVIDYLAPYFGTTGISIVMRKPVRQSSLFKFMTVLRLEVWLSIIGALVATAVMIWFLDKFSPYSSRNNPEAYPFPCREFTLRESFWFALTSFTPQGGGEAPKAVSGRILVGAYWLFVVLMLATFTANLAAFLTVERMQTPVQNLEQLARQSRINYTVVSESDTHHFFINMKFAEDTLYRLWKELALNESKDFHKFRIWDYPIKEQYGRILLAINSSEPMANASEGFRKVNEAINSDFAFIHDSCEIKYEITRNCNLTEIGEVFAEQPYGIAVQQGSHLSDELSFTLLELQKIRFFEELQAKHWNASHIKECSMAEEEEGITLESLGGVFIATFFGLGFAMVILALEVIYHKRKLREKTKKASNKITQVYPIENSSADEKRSKKKGKSWLIDKKDETSKITPPPSFESATHFRGRKIPPSITLGGKEFKPRRRGVGDNTELPGYTEGVLPANDSIFPSYME